MKSEDQMIELRKQLADTIKYLRRKKMTCLRRAVVRGKQVHCSSLSEETVEDIIDILKKYPSDYEVHFSDNDGYSVLMEIFPCGKETDHDYFERICSYLLPTDYQQRQYADYLRLKKMFEGST